MDKRILHKLTLCQSIARAKIFINQIKKLRFETAHYASVFVSPAGFQHGAAGFFQQKRYRYPSRYKNADVKYIYQYHLRPNTGAGPPP